MQSEAKRSPRGSSLQFAICREIFRNCRESRCIGCQIFQCFQPFKGSSPYLASSEHFSVLQGRAARDCECSRVGFADSTSAVAGAAARRRMEPDARRRNSDICPFPETAYRLAGNKGGSGARPPRRRLQGEPFNVSSETAHHPKGKDMPVAMRPNKVIRSAARMCSGTSRRDQVSRPAEILSVANKPEERCRRSSPLANGIRAIPRPFLASPVAIFHFACEPML
jgi:hypothetical protein